MTASLWTRYPRASRVAFYSLGSITLGAIGWGIGRWVYSVFVPQVAPLVLGTSTVLFALLHFGVGRIEDGIKESVTLLRTTRTPRTAKLQRYLDDKRRSIHAGRVVSMIVGSGAGMAAALLSGVPALTDHPTALNAAIGRALVSAGFASLCLLCVATTITLSVWRSLRPFEREVHDLVELEASRNRVLEALGKGSGAILPLEGNPVPFKPTGAPM